jgi:hypothetical protein
MDEERDCYRGRTAVLIPSCRSREARQGGGLYNRTVNIAWSLLPTVVSVAALTISVITAWLTFFRKGTIQMTNPTVVYFGSSLLQVGGLTAQSGRSTAA